MTSILQSKTYQDIHEHLDSVRMIDCHEHVQRESAFPSAERMSFGRLFMVYTRSDLISAGGPADKIELATGNAGGPAAPSRAWSDAQRWRVLGPWYKKAWNTTYCEAIRLSIQKLWGIDDVTAKTYTALTEAMRRDIRPGFTRKAFDVAGIDFAMHHPFGTRIAFNGDFDPDTLLEDMVDDFSVNPPTIAAMSRDCGFEIDTLGDFLKAIDVYFERYAAVAGAFKCGRAYQRSLFFEEVPQSEAERIFPRVAATERPDSSDVRVLEDFIMHYLCRKCGEHGLRMKFHTGYLSGNAGVVANARAGLLVNLFKRYPKVNFDLYHISYPYQDELAAIAKTFPNVTVDFCWAWIINPLAARRALGDMLDSVPANKIHGFGGDYRTVELVVGHAAIARREIASVLAEKVAEGRFSQAYACELGTGILRDNAMENFDLHRRRKAFRAWQRKERRTILDIQHSMLNLQVKGGALEH